MRHITKSVYTFNELSDKAKEVARNWWRNCEASDPAWQSEHEASYKAALKAIKSLGDDPTAEDWSKVREDSKNCVWTGYCADCVLSDNASDEIPTARQAQAWYEDAWSADVAAQMEDEAVDDAITCNGYEFYDDGRLAD